MYFRRSSVYRFSCWFISDCPSAFHDLIFEHQPPQGIFSNAPACLGLTYVAFSNFEPWRVAFAPALTSSCDAKAYFDSIKLYSQVLSRHLGSVNSDVLVTDAQLKHCHWAERLETIFYSGVSPHHYYYRAQDSGIGPSYRGSMVAASYTVSWYCCGFVKVCGGRTNWLFCELMEFCSFLGAGLNSENRQF